MVPVGKKSGDVWGDKYRTKCEWVLKTVQDEVTHPPQSHDQECHELQTVRSQLENSSSSTKATALQQAKQVELAWGMKRKRRERETFVALSQKLEKDKE